MAIACHGRTDRSDAAKRGQKFHTASQKGVIVMITSNINLNDFLINGQFGVVFDFGYYDSSISKVSVKLDVKNAAKEAMPKYLHATKHKVISTQRIDASIIISKNPSQTFKRTQFLLTLAWFSSTVVSLELIKQVSLLVT